MTSSYRDIVDSARASHLDVLGAFHPVATDQTPGGAGTLILLGPHEPGFWTHVKADPDFHDGAANPLDRWSMRVVGALAAKLGAVALFPFGEPPYQPFVGWALRSGRAWQSPAGLLVHDQAGLMVSYRGALALPDRIDLPAALPCPCDACETKPCLSACPVNALRKDHYDLAACHGYLDTIPGRDCLNLGCAARRSCPVSQSYGRLADQSAFHMKAFHP